MIALSQRLLSLNNKLHEESYKKIHPWQFENVNILDIPGNEDIAQASIPVRKALAQIYTAQHLKIEIQPGELLIGNPAMSSVEFPTSVVGYLAETEKEYFQKFGMDESSLYGHHPPRWENLLARGTETIKEEILQELRCRMDKEESCEEQLDYLRAMYISLDALSAYAGRCASMAIEAAQAEQNHAYRHELLNIAEICGRIPMKPAQSLHEALQSYWLTYSVLASTGEFLPLGRIDQIFGKFYENDILSGALTEEQAQDLIGCFLLKCNGLVTLRTKDIRPPQLKSAAKSKLEHYYRIDEPETSEHNRTFGQEVNNRMMTCVVGGVGRDGTDATNTLSYLFIELMHAMKLLLPTIGARISHETPKAFLELVARVLRHGQGEPIIYNDEAIISNHVELGIPREEISEYSSDGCWEVLIPGKTNFFYTWVHSLQCLEWTMHNGYSVHSGQRDGMITGELDEYKTFEEFYDAYWEQMNFQMLKVWKSWVSSQGQASLVAPDPLFSSFSDDCISRASDFYDSGARYQIRCLMMTGLADTVDSLAVIKKLIFEERQLNLRELRQVLLDNFTGHERLRAQISSRVPKYGSGDEYADSLAVRIIEDFSKVIRTLRKQYDGFILTGGIGTFHVYGSLAQWHGASPNGRFAWDALAPNYSPVQGVDHGGPLLELASSLKPDLSELMTGTPVDISINANEFCGEAGINRLKHMIETYMGAGGQIMSVTATSRRELLDAMEHPEQHQSLRVRMGGLSAYFVQLVPEQQRKILDRFSQC